MTDINEAIAMLRLARSAFKASGDERLKGLASATDDLISEAIEERAIQIRAQAWTTLAHSIERAEQ